MSIFSKEIFVVSELRHIDEACLQSGRGKTILCFDYLVEQELIKKNVPHLSATDFADREGGEEEWWKLSHQIAGDWYRLPTMKFFEYQSIRIAEAPEPLMQAYLARIFYYVRLYSVLKKDRPDSQLIIPVPTVSVSSSPDCLAAFHPWAIIDAARMVGLSVTTTDNRTKIRSYVFPKTTWKIFILWLFNVFIGFAPPRRFKVYSSEYWAHLSSVVPYLDDAELILFESKEFYRIPWKKILKHRIRVRYSDGIVSRSDENRIRKIAEKFESGWKDAKKDIAHYLSGICENLEWDPILEACEHIITYAPRVVADIDSLRSIMLEEKPDIVLQMASVGGPQHYFFLMACVARQLGITSVELQHATATIDPRSVFSRLETDYLLTYGPDINLWHERLGHAHNRLVAVGSPRFDKYINERAQGLERGKKLFRQLGLDVRRPVLFVAVPFSDNFASAVDSYQLASFFKSVREIQDRISGLQIIFKCRARRDVAVTQKYLYELFRGDWVVSASEDIFALLSASDAVVCNNSTVIYQAVLTRRPLVLYPWKFFDSYHAHVYAPLIPIFYNPEEAVLAVSRIFTDKAYRDDLLLRQEQFLGGYSFDGKSSQRVAKTVKLLAKR
ncbi:CDP-glycerol glycerophosphotransferase family protein [Candidatus Nomurabacteria bacterium]|nr:CDP-glycerol glycerophosphotransferase family protein [Candidatus Nomurabacteria bacterium]